MHRYLLRNLMDFISRKERKNFAGALKVIYRATDADAAEKALTEFEAGLGGSAIPLSVIAGGAPGARSSRFLRSPDKVRRIIYTTNAIEAVNAKLRRAVRAKGNFPNDEVAIKLLYLILNRLEKEWKMPPREWTMAKAQSAAIFGERFIRAMAP